MKDKDMTSRPTVRTDAVISPAFQPSGDQVLPYAGDWVPADFARQLERDLAAAREELNRVDSVLSRRDALDDAPDRVAKILTAIKVAQANDPKGELAKAEQRAALLESQLAEAKVDAARYRWLRDVHNQGAHSPDGEGLMVVTDCPSKTPRYVGPLCDRMLDAAIDKAIDAAPSAVPSGKEGG